MLFLSQADRGSAVRRVPTASLAGVARQVSDYHDAALDDAGVTVEVIGDIGGSFDLPLLQRALCNLLANATRYATRGSTIHIEIETPPGGEVRLALVNQGETIEPGALATFV